MADHRAPARAGAAATAAAESALPHDVLGYRVTGYLGHGAGSRIYAGRGPLGEAVAVKHVVPKTDREQRYVEQLVNEYDVGRKVAHPGLRRPLALKVRRNWLLRPAEAVLVMELFEGERLDRLPPPGVARLIAYFVQAAAAIGALHAAGFLHCDTKPNNLLVNAAGVVKVIDLGQACPVGSRKKRVQGTADYMAPEQVRLAEMTVRTDVFNLGATLYWALARRPIPTLFTIDRGANNFLVDRRIATPSELNPGVPETLSNIVMDCVRTNPAKRPRDMKELIVRLETVKYALDRRAAAEAQPHESPSPPPAAPTARATAVP